MNGGKDSEVLHFSWLHVDRVDQLVDELKFSVDETVQLAVEDARVRMK